MTILYDIKIPSQVLYIYTHVFSNINSSQELVFAQLVYLHFLLESLDADESHCLALQHQRMCTYFTNGTNMQHLVSSNSNKYLVYLTNVATNRCISTSFL